MDFVFTPFALLAVAAGTIALSVAAYLWRRRMARGARPLALLMLAVGHWSLSFSLVQSGDGLATQEFWLKVAFVGVVTAPAGALAFALQYTDRGHWLSRRAWAALAIEPLVTLVLVFTNDRHHLMWTVKGLETSGPVRSLDLAFGPWFLINAGYSYVLVAGATFLLISVLAHSQTLYRKQSAVLLLAAAAPWVTNGVYVLGLSPLPALDLTPVGFTLTGLALGWNLFRFRLLDLVPVAHHRMIEGMSDGVIVLDGERRIVDLNPAARRILDGAVDLIGRRISDVLPVSPHLLDHLNERNAHAEVQLDVGSALHDYALVLSGLENRAGRQTGYLLVLRDITERKQAERALAEREQRYRSLFEQNPDCVYSLDLDGNIRAVNPACERISGYSADQLMGRPFVAIACAEDARRVRDHAQSVLRGESQFFEMAIRHQAGHRVELSVTNLPIVVDGQIVGIHGIAKDVTKQHELERQLRHQTFHDSLTDLPNRTLLMERLSHALAYSRRRSSRVAVFVIGIDHFRLVNDGLGRDVGDYVLRAVGRRLQSCVRPGDTVARLGGDEFAILLEDVLKPTAVIGVAERIMKAMSGPVPAGWRELALSASIGISLSRSPDDRPEMLLSEASAALSQAKARGRGCYQIFDPCGDRPALDRLDLESDLRRALERDELRVFYQPIVSLSTGEIVSMEALVRWEHPRRGIIGPDEFISLAEETGIIVPIGLRVLRQACWQAREWHRHQVGPRRWGIHVNLSGRQLLDPKLVAEVFAALEETGLEPGHLVLEITESVAIEQPESTLATLRALKDLGVRLAVDDFGTGYTALSSIKSFPVDSLKIDRLFVAGMGHDPEYRVIVGIIVELAHSLGMNLVAEGVETAEQADALRRLGCDAAQGYYFMRPQPASGVEIGRLMRVTENDSKAEDHYDLQFDVS